MEAVTSGARTTDDAVATTEEARQSFLRIDQAVENVTRRVAEIAEAIGTVAINSELMETEMTDVAAVAEEASASTEEISASAQQTSASAEQIAASAKELAKSSADLERAVSEFSLGKRA